MHIYKGISVIKELEIDANIYIIDGEVIVDTGTGKFFSDMKAKIEDKLQPEKIKKIICTHYHYDHTGGANDFREWLGAKVMIHEADSQFLESGKTLSEFYGKHPVPVTVDGVLRNKDHIVTDNFNFEIISTPGHTPGSICLYEKDKKILISGDTIFSDNIGRCDLNGGNINDMLTSLVKLHGLPVEYLLPGHGIHKVGGFNFLIKQMINKINK